MERWSTTSMALAGPTGTRCRPTIPRPVIPAGMGPEARVGRGGPAGHPDLGVFVSLWLALRNKYHEDTKAGGPPSRKPRAGSTLAARRAGRKPARAPIAASTAIAAANVGT